ncbi:DNA replication/repair protein RecF [Nakamurella sp. A5-74]|uniref:DNA replication and repair protein RecF n=1 Tax=Nakamurella sp. A5-74 TaxID=3158264 RepID=A0AAU8DQN5_9ACTN
MYVRHLTVADFRSWELVEVPLQQGVNVLVGRNGVGKTNLVEAVGYLATLASHRVSTDQALIRRGREQAMIRAAVVSQERELLLEIDITAGRANKARINRSPVTRARDILGVVRTVLFAPEDLALVRGDPSERRKFMDELLVMRTPRLAGVRSDYERILKQRNTLLKTSGVARRSGRTPDLSTLDVWDDHLAAVGAELIVQRRELVAALQPHVIAAYAELAPASEPIDLLYRSTVLDGPGDVSGYGTEPGLPGDAPIEQVRAAMVERLQERRSAELERGVSLVGPHRDELELTLGSGPARGYASHGESWSFALALRLGSFALLRTDGVDPVLVLDDVFAELDTGRRDQLAALIADAEQVLITAAVDSDVPAVLGGTRIRIADGQVST